MPFEELLRYTIPGYVALTPILLLYLLFSTSTTSDDKILTAIIGILVLIGPAAGFVIQQFHMFMHERFLYANPKKRRILELIIRKFREEKAEWKDKPILGFEALLAWDYFFHSEEMDKDLKAHQLRTWYFIHSFRGAAWAFGVGFAILLIGIVSVLLAQIRDCPITSNESILVYVCWVAVVYFVAVNFFLVKSRSTERFLWRMEKLTVLKKWDGKDGIKECLELILREKHNITCYPGIEGAT